MTSNGKISFEGSKLHHNYAIQNPLGLILETIKTTSISNSQIYENFEISQEELQNTIAGN